MNLKTWMIENTTDGLVTDICATFTGGVLATVHEKGVDEVIDHVLYSRHGKQIMDEELTEDPEDLTMAVTAYLMERGRYMLQVIAYIESEYNPIENYSQHEEESIDTTYAERTDHGTDTKAEDTFRHGQHIDSQNYAQYSDTQKNPQYTDTMTTGKNGYDVTQHTAKVQTQTTPPGDTSTTSVAPFDDDTFHNKEQTAVSHTAGTQTVERIATGTDSGNDKTSFSQRVDETMHEAHNVEMQHGQHTDQFTYAQYDDIAHVGGTEDSYEHVTDERTDNISRELDRSGNIGVQTAAQMLQLDEAFWWNFRPFQKIAREIAALITEGVTVL